VLGGLGAFLVGCLVGVAWACTGAGEAEARGEDGGVALMVGWVSSTTVVAPPAATVAASEELGGGLLVWAGAWLVGWG